MTHSVTVRSRFRRFCGTSAAVRCVVFTLAIGIPAAGRAQDVPFGGAQRATRLALAERVAQLEQQASARDASGSTKSRANAELALIRMRLQHGDFRVGDRFVITLRQDSLRSDTASVRDSLQVSVSNLPDVSLDGVLRSELDERMTAHVARYLRNVTVRTSVLTRVAILGAVRAPGFYWVSPDRPLSDVLMAAGGPVDLAKQTTLEITRGSTVLVKAKASPKLIKEGKTLEQLDVQSGDEIRIPIKKKFNPQVLVQSMLVLSSLLFAGMQFISWYYSRQE